MENYNWGAMIGNTINFGRDDRSPKCKKIKKGDSRYKKFQQSGHVMIYARTAGDFEGFPKKALILMQMRSDGCIGFPGGVAADKETPVQAVCRGVREDLGWSEVSDANYAFTHADEEYKSLMHFYVKEITEDKLAEIEYNSLRSSSYNNEVLGYLKVPLYTLGDAFRGFPAFLKNHFVGISKLQLLEAIATLKLLTGEQIVQALHSAPRITT